MAADNSPIVAHITPQTSLLPTIRAWEIYLMDQDRSPYTIKAFIGDLRLLASYLPPDSRIGTITTNDLNHFLQWLQKGRGVPCSPKSLSRRITSIKSFFRWLHKNGILLVDPAEKVVQHSVISPLPQVLTMEEEQRALDVARSYQELQKPDTRHYTLLALLLSTGIKKGECLAITLNHIDIESPTGSLLFVRYADPRYRYKERKILLPGDWVISYKKYLDQYQPVDELFPWSPRRLEYLLEDVGNKAGLNKHLSFDMCRWTCALNDKRSGMEPEQIRQKLGISKVQWREIHMKLRKLSGEGEGATPPATVSGAQPAA